MCGDKGMVFEGARARWRRIAAPLINFYSLAVFRERVYLAAGGDGVFVVDGDTVSLVKKGPAFYKLVGSQEMLYLTGGDFAARFNGEIWQGNRFT